MTQPLDYPEHLRSLPVEDFFTELDELPDELADDALWERCRSDLALFCVVFFSERFGKPYNRMHADFLERPKVPWEERTQEVYQADAAPRGGAKSTIESFASLLHDAVYGYELYIALISTTYDLSEDLVSDLYSVLTSPDVHEDFHQVYGPFQVVGGKTDFVLHVRGGDARGIRFKSFSFNGSVRGTKHAGVRPTKVVIDDGEHPERVRSPEQRRKTRSYLDKDVLKAGDTYTTYRVVGTVLHKQSMLNELLSEPAWKSKRWKAMLSWPRRMDLWATCRGLWADLTDPDRMDSARRFYERHRDLMDAGAEVLWPEHEPLFKLMQLWWQNRAAFNSEKQNDPVDPDRQCFDVEGLRRCHFDGEKIVTAEGRTIMLTACTLSVWLDPRASHEVLKNDFAALALVAKGPHGYRFVLRVWMGRVGPVEQRKRYWAVFDQFGPRCRYGYEDNGFAALNDEGFMRERRDRQQAKKPWRMAVKGYTSKQRKEDRILSMQPECELGWIQFADDLPAEFMGQLEAFPTGAHDDGPDAVERALWLLTEAGEARFGGWDG